MPSPLRTPRRLDLPSLSVLIVDDQPFFRVLLGEVLRNLQVRDLSVASDGEEALEAYHMLRPSVVLTDWIMPVMDGLELTRAIRSLPDEDAREVPIIMITANNRRSQIETARAAGVDEFILKPVSIKSVCDRLREVVERPRPFISAPTYKGPCRRRQVDAKFRGPWRRIDDPIEIQTEDEVESALMSVVAMTSAKIAALTRGLAAGQAGNVRAIVSALGEVRSIGEEMADRHLVRVAQLLLEYLRGVGSADKVRPDVIQTHLSALDVLVRTPRDQKRVRDQVVTGLDKVVKKTTAA